MGGLSSSHSLEWYGGLLGCRVLVFSFLSNKVLNHFQVSKGKTMINPKQDGL